MNPIIIIPTYNEAENIKKLIPIIFEKMDIAILVVDDNSPDGTANLVEELMQKYPNIHLLKRKNKDGLASAYIEGFKYSLENGYNVIVQMDSDFQHPFDKIPEMLNEIETKNADIIIGSRYIKNGNWKNANKNKELISRIGNIYARIVLNSKIKDITGGYNIWTKNALNKISLDSIISKGYMFQVEMKYKAEKNNLKIIEFPITFNQRLNGISKMNVQICLEALINIWKIKFKY